MRKQTCAAAVFLSLLLVAAVFAPSTVTDTFTDESKIAAYHQLNVDTVQGLVELENKTVSERETPYNSSGLVAHYHMNDFSHTSNDNRTGVATGKVTDASGEENHGDLFYVSQTDLKGWWAFEDGNASSTFTDLSGNGNTGTWSGKASGDKNVTQSYDGLRDAAYFDGVNDCVTVTDDSSLNFVSNFSLVVWVKTVGNAEDDGRVIAKRLGQIGYELYINSAAGYLEAFIGDASGYMMMTSFSFSFVDGVYHHIVFKRAGDQMFMYIDGEFNKQQTTTVTGDLSNSQNLFFGKYAGDIRWFNGTIDGVCLYNRALSQNEIEAEYRQWTEGILNEALHFDGVNTYVDVTDDSSLTLLVPFTLEAWVKRETKTDANGMIMTKDWNYQLYRGSSYKITVAFRDQSAGQWRTVSSNAPIPAEFTHVAATLEANGSDTLIKIYLNASLDNSATVTGQPGEYAQALRIGANQLGTERFVGIIDETRIYTRALSAAEIKESYEDYLASGVLYSTNLLKDQNATEIQAFGYNVSVAGVQEITLQFSQDNLTWVDSDGIVGGSEACTAGVHTINLKGLGWKGNFYYRANFTRDPTPELFDITVTFSTVVTYAFAAVFAGVFLIGCVMVVGVLVVKAGGRRR